MVAANEYLARTVDSRAVNLQDIEIPQQFADLGEWNEWVVGHFTRNQAQNADEVANGYLSGRSLTDV